MCAFYIKGLCGFANTLVFTSILSFGTANINISPVELVLGYPTNLIISWKERKSIDWKICLPLAGMVIIGSLPGQAANRQREKDKDRQKRGRAGAACPLFIRKKDGIALSGDV